MCIYLEANEITSIILSSSFSTSFFCFGPARPSKPEYRNVIEYQNIQSIMPFQCLMMVNDWKGVLCTIHRFLFTESNLIEKYFIRNSCLNPVFFIRFVYIFFFHSKNVFENWKHSVKRRGRKKKTVQCSRERFSFGCCFSFVSYTHTHTHKYSANK